jgi:hypothetical protein
MKPHRGHHHLQRLRRAHTASQAIADLENLMNEATALELTHGPHSPRFIELRKLIPVQERLVLDMMDDDLLFTE